MADRSRGLHRARIGGVFPWARTIAEQRVVSSKAAFAPLLAAASRAAQPMYAQRGPAPEYSKRPLRLGARFPPGRGDRHPPAHPAAVYARLDRPAGALSDRGGATGTIAAAVAAKAAAAGNTFFTVPSGTCTIRASTWARLLCDAGRDFARVSLRVWVANAIGAARNPPAKTLQDLIRIAREQPRRFTCSGSGAGCLHHLSGEVLRRLTRTARIPTSRSRAQAPRSRRFRAAR